MQLNVSSGLWRRIFCALAALCLFSSTSLATRLRCEFQECQGSIVGCSLSNESYAQNISATVVSGGWSTAGHVMLDGDAVISMADASPFALAPTHPFRLTLSMQIHDLPISSSVTPGVLLSELSEGLSGWLLSIDQYGRILFTVRANPGAGELLRVRTEDSVNLDFHNFTTVDVLYEGPSSALPVRIHVNSIEYSLSLLWNTLTNASIFHADDFSRVLSVGVPFASHFSSCTADVNSGLRMSLAQVDLRSGEDILGNQTTGPVPPLECPEDTVVCHANRSKYSRPASGVCECLHSLEGQSFDPGTGCRNCSDGYFGSSCSEPDECFLSTHDCSPFATCTKLPGTYSCTCNTGYFGPGTTCTRVTPSATISASTSVTSSVSSTSSPSVTGTLTSSISSSTTSTTTTSLTSTASETPSASGSLTETSSFSASSSISATESASSTVTMTSTFSSTSSASGSVSATNSVSGTSSYSGSESASSTVTMSSTPTPTQSGSRSVTETSSASVSSSHTGTGSASSSGTMTRTSSKTMTATPTSTRTSSKSPSRTRSHTSSITPSRTSSTTASRTKTPSRTPTSSRSKSRSATPSPSRTTSPATIPIQYPQGGLIGYFTGESVATDATGTAVNEWTDLHGSGANFHVLSGVSDPPTVSRTNFPSGTRSFLHFETASGLVRSASPLQAPYTMFLVARYSGSQNRNRIMQSMDTNYVFGFHGTKKGMYSGTWVTDQNHPMQEAQIGRWYVCLVVAMEGYVMFFVDGMDMTVFRTSGQNPMRLALNRGGLFNEFSDCDVAHVSIFNRGLTFSETQGAFSYLSDMYGIDINYDVANIGNIRTWNRPEELFGTPVGAPISMWPPSPQVPGVPLAQERAALPPSVASSQFGLPVIRFDTNLAGLTYGNLLSIPSNSFTIFIMNRYVDPATIGRSLQGRDQNFLIGLWGGNHGFYSICTDWVGTRQNGNTWTLDVALSGAAGSKFYSSGIEFSNGPRGTACAPGVLELAGLGQANEFSRYEVAEILIIDRDLHLLQIQFAQEYFSRKYGII